MGKLSAVTLSPSKHVSKDQRTPFDKLRVTPFNKKAPPIGGAFLLFHRKIIATRCYLQTIGHGYLLAIQRYLLTCREYHSCR